MAARQILSRSTGARLPGSTSSTPHAPPQQQQQQHPRWQRAGAAAAGLALALQAASAVACEQVAQVHVLPQPVAVVVQQQRVAAGRSSSIQQHVPQERAQLAGWFGGSEEPEDPFTLFGTTFKKYSIEELQGEDVVSRKRGFTVDSCISGKAASDETPMFNGLSPGAKAQAGDDLLCRRATGTDLKPVCKESCAASCGAALDAYEERLFAVSGLTLEPKERQRVLRNCRHACSYECSKSGRAHDFAVPSRR